MKFSYEHKMCLLRDTVLSAFVGTAVALLPLWTAAETIDRVVIGVASGFVGWCYIVASDRAIQRILEDEHRWK